MKQQRDHLCWVIAVFWVLFSHSGAPAGAAEKAAFDPASAYRLLRKDFLIASALPAAGTTLRKEHVAYLRSSTTFIKRLNPESGNDKPYLIAGLSTRGLILLECGRDAQARQDFDRALALFPPREKGETGAENDELPAAEPSLKLPVGCPGWTDIRLYRALTFARGDGGAFIAELGAVPASKTFFGQDALKKKVWAFAEELSAGGKYDEAIAVYEMIIKHSLWEEGDPSDPRRLIEIMRVQKENTAGQ
ncbi:MAG: hypothetical protein RRC34_05330 [Lentisphaeria bacterium]|nr:hypothetical protein [Lentisphaeria bacterium]